MCRQYGLTSLTCLGGFKNLRKEFEWEGFVLELDETAYEWGTLYELECETASVAGRWSLRSAHVARKPGPWHGCSMARRCV